MLETQIFGVPILEWIGYIASVVVLLSLSMSSIIKLRWYNLTGALLFSIYGFLIGSLPVGIVNFLIMMVNIVNLKKIYFRREDFKILEVKEDDNLLPHIVEFYQRDINKFFPGFYLNSEKNWIGFFILRNMTIAGIFLATKEDNANLRIDLDYALPEFRDFKVGKYLYNRLDKILEEQGFCYLNCYVETNFNYFKKMGFAFIESEKQLVMQRKLSG